MSLWAKLLGRFGLAPREPRPQEVLAAHIAALAERQARDRVSGASGSSRPRRLAVLPDAGQLRVRVEVGLSSVEIFHDSLKLRVRLSPEQFLVNPMGLSDERRSLLQAFGFRRPSGSGEFEAEYPCEGRRALAESVTRLDVLFSELFKLTPGAGYQVSIERGQVRTNDALIGSIRTLVKERDFESRRRLYQELVNAWVYVPLLHEEESSEAPSVQRFEDRVDGRDLWPIFTDLGALREYRASAEPYALVSGIRLVQAARAHQLGGLKINPRSNVGGELLSNELESLAGYLDGRGLMKV